MGRRCTYKRRSKGATLGLTGPDVALKPFGALVHIDCLEMKNGSKAHGIAARALLITDQETEFWGVPPSKRKLASEVVRRSVDSFPIELLSSSLPAELCGLLDPSPTS